MSDKVLIIGFLQVCSIICILQICAAIIIPVQEQPRPIYSSGIKTTIRKDSTPYNLQNYSKVIVQNRPDGTGARYVTTKSTNVQNVYPVYNAYKLRLQNHNNILQTQSYSQIDASQFSSPNRTIFKRKIETKTLEVYSRCPSGATGQYIYSVSCNQFLNCWKGRGTVQNCAPGTLFNPKSLECDFPNKVECITGPQSITLDSGRGKKSILQAQCPAGFSGTIPDYFDCSKFINCDNGETNIMACPPGTLFDMNKNMCDYPHKTTCFNGDNAADVKMIPVQWQFQGHGSYDSQDSQLPCNSKHQDCEKGVQSSTQTNCNSQTRNCIQTNKQKGNYGQTGFNTDQTANSANTIKQKCNPAYQNCGRPSANTESYDLSPDNVDYKPNSFGYVENTYFSDKCSPSDTNCQTQIPSQSQAQGVHIQICDPSIQNCDNDNNNGLGQRQYQNTGYKKIGNDHKLVHIPSTIDGCNPQTQNCEQLISKGQNVNQNQYYLSTNDNTRGYKNTYSNSGLLCNPTTQNCDTKVTNIHTQVYSSRVNGNCNPLVQNCDENGEQTQKPNFSKICNVNDYRCRQNKAAVTQRPDTKKEPVCPYGAVGLHKHPTDCQKFLSCANGQTFIMDCAPGTLFNSKTGICDFPYNVQCELSATSEESLEINSGAYDNNWRNQHNHKMQNAENNGGQGTIRKVAIGNPNSSIIIGWGQNINNAETITERNRGQSGFVIRPQSKTSDYEAIHNFPHQTFATTARSISLLPQRNQENNIDDEYEFTYENGDPIILEPENIFDIQEKYTKVCEEGDFHCTSKLCISMTMVCDGNRDCADGRDELNCQEYTERFSLRKKSQLVVVENQRWLNVSRSTCAVLCIQNKNFTCRSFTYRISNKSCFLSDKNIGLTGALQTHQSSDYYELKDGTINCSNTSKYYECRNKKCLTRDYLCDGYNDCEDREDEKHCGAEKFGFKIKLTGSNEKNEGRVEVTAFGSTGYICDDDFSIVDANVVCRELGFKLGAAEVKGQSQFAKDLDERNTLYLIDDLNCIGNETSIIDCSFPGWGIHNCRDQEIAGVVCKTQQEKCAENSWKCDTGNECIPFDFVCDGVEDCADDSDEAVQHCEAPTEIRLVGGTYSGEGRLEIKHNGIWGTVCDDDFNEDAAKVVCKFLEYKGQSFVKKDAYFGAGSGPIWLDQVSCYGNETELQQCTHWHWGEHNCEHSEDVGVICSQDAEEVKVERHSNLPLRVEEGLPKECGLRKDNIFAINDLIHPRVIGGGMAKKGDYPWQAALKVRVQNKSAHWCGAIIISSRWVLTAAHCLQGYSKGAYVILAGEYNTDEDEITKQQKYIDEYFVHENFRKGHKLNNDIGLIKVKGNGFELNDHVQPICLADANTDYNKELNCTISGFGSVKSGTSAYSHNLLAAWIPIYSKEICTMPHVYGDVLTDGMICAGSLDGGLDACDGDSGGPLACLDHGVFTLYGITSWGHHCGYANKPGVYVKVAHYRQWIEDTISQHS